MGNTVNAKTASFTNSIGAPELGAVWSDPDFDPSQRAFYYARVIEIPTPRWSTYDAVRFGIDLPKDTPVSTQDRAYTSPIWYSPSKPPTREEAPRKGMNRKPKKSQNGTKRQPGKRRPR